MPPPKFFSIITPKLALFYMTLLYYKLHYIVPTLTVMLKPISYLCANFIMILVILLRMIPQIRVEMLIGNPAEFEIIN